MPKSLKFFKDYEKARVYRNRQRRKNYHKTRDGAYNTNRRWTMEEINIILNSPLSDREISDKIGRTVQAIQGKRVRLKMGR